MENAEGKPHPDAWDHRPGLRGLRAKAGGGGAVNCALVAPLCIEFCMHGTAGRAVQLSCGSTAVWLELYPIHMGRYMHIPTGFAVYSTV